jgi:hypothetical protein
MSRLDDSASLDSQLQDLGKQLGRHTEQWNVSNQGKNLSPVSPTLIVWSLESILVYLG